MALSFIEVNPTTSGQTVYSNINLQFVSTEDIFVTIKKADATVITLTSTQYEVTTSPTLTVTITDSAVSSAIAVNDTIRVFRDTNVSSPARIFSNGSVLKASDLNANHNQILFAQQENDELGIGDALQKDASGAFWDATNLNIRNVLDAVESSDAVTLGQVNAALASAGSVPSVPQSYSTASGTLLNGAISGSDTVFDMTPPPTSEFEQTFIVEIDGVIQRPNDDYTITTGTTVGTLRILGADVRTQSIVVTNFGLSRQVFDFPSVGQAVTSTTTPLTLQGHASQSACIFIVEQSDGDDIFCVNNDHVIVNGYGTTTPFTVKQNTDGVATIARFQNAAGQTVHHFKDPTESSGGFASFYEITDHNTVNAGKDHMLILRRTAVNDANNSERGAFFICKGNDGVGSPSGGQGRDVFKITQNGKVQVTATDDTIAGQKDNAAALLLRYHHTTLNDPANYISCMASNGKERFAIGYGDTTNPAERDSLAFNLGTGQDATTTTVTIGNRDPDGDNLHQLRCFAIPQQDTVSGTGNTVPYFRFILQGNKASNNRRGLCELNTMAQNSGEALLVRTVADTSANSKLIELNYDGNILIQDVVKGRTKVDASVLRRDEIREDSPQYANIAVAYANPITRAQGSPFSGNNTPVTFQELNTSGYLSTSVVQAETNTEVRIQTAGTYLVEVGCSVSTRQPAAGQTNTVVIKLQEANGTGSFAEIARVEGLAPSTSFIGGATLNYKRIVTITELRKYKILVDSQSTGFAFASDFQGAFISIQRLSN
jgi:peptide methionine sulfoxide reductase MsrB